MNQERLLKVLLAPHISEKSAIAADHHSRQVFDVLPDATKTEVKRAVEMLFKVKVEAVQIMNVKGKSKRFGAFLGRRPNWKKAYVRLAPGDDIDFMGSE